MADIEAQAAAPFGDHQDDTGEDKEVQDLPPFLAGIVDQLMAVPPRPTVQKQFPVPSIGRVVLYRTYLQDHQPVLFPAIVMDVEHPQDPFSTVKLWIMRDHGPQIVWAYYSLDGSGWFWPPFVPPVTIEVPAD